MTPSNSSSGGAGNAAVPAISAVPSCTPTTALPTVFTATQHSAGGMFTANAMNNVAAAAGGGVLPTGFGNTNMTTAAAAVAAAYGIAAMNGHSISLEKSIASIDRQRFTSMKKSKASGSRSHLHNDRISVFKMKKSSSEGVSNNNNVHDDNHNNESKSSETLPEERLFKNRLGPIAKRESAQTNSFIDTDGGD